MTRNDDAGGLPEQMRSDDPRNPFHDAELVLYSAEADKAEEEPVQETLQKLGVTSWSLWARWREKGVEVPIVCEASWRIWFSLSADQFHPDPGSPVSDAFVGSIAQMVDESVGDGWGDVEDRYWDGMSKLECYVHNLIRTGFLLEESPIPALVIDYCKTRHEEGLDRG